MTFLNCFVPRGVLSEKLCSSTVQPTFLICFLMCCNMTMRTVRAGDTTHNNTYFSHFPAPLGADSPGDEDGVQVLYKVPLVSEIVSKVVEVLRGDYSLPLGCDGVVNILTQI